MNGGDVQLMTTTISCQNQPTKAKLVQNLKVLDLDENEYTVLTQCFSTKSLPVSNSEIPSKVDLSNCGYLDGIALPYLDADVGLLIGSDYPNILQPRAFKQSQEGGPFAYKTLLGWVVVGPTSPKLINTIEISFFVKSESSQMCSYLALPQKIEMSINDQRFLSHVTRSIQLNDDQHYEIALPLRYPSLKMPSNRSFVEKRLMYLKRKFAKNPSFYDDYVKFVDKILSSGYAEKAGKPQHDD